MPRMLPRLRAMSPLVLLLVTACAGAVVQTGPTPTAADNEARTAAARENALRSRYPHVVADVRFMQGMIGHHAQAVTISRWAPTHGARNDIQIMAARIVVSQLDEINLMQTWLRDRNEAVPDSTHREHEAGAMPGMDHGLMPGMLTPDQMKQLDSARGSEFDRLFLTFMIQHHNGAVVMVEQLFATYGAGQDDAIFKFASDVAADQASEVARMERMLEPISPSSSRP